MSEENPQARGGKARAAKMTKAERSAAAKRAAEERWSKLRELPRATHEGDLELGNASISCYVLEDGTRLLSNSGMVRALGMKRGSSGEGASDRLRWFVDGQRVKPHLPERLTPMVEQPIEFVTTRGAKAYGYPAEALADICDAVLEARKQGDLQSQQLHIAQQCEILVRGFARVGIVALVDEATGYQFDRDRQALAKILEAFIAKELAQWVKTFPDEFYRELSRLRGLTFHEDSNKRPPLFGCLTADIVYRRLAPGVLDELRAKNPRTASGRRKAAHHQWLTREIGHPKLREHLAKVTALMQVSPDYETFRGHLDKVAPRFGDTLHLDFDDAPTA